MKPSFYKTLLFSLAFPAVITVVACKSKDGETDNKDTVNTYMEPKLDNTSTSPDTMPVEITHDDSLSKMTGAAVKDFPGVVATINDGEVILTGTIKRDRLPKLMQTINSMHPKKVTNNLTIQ